MTPMIWPPTRSGTLSIDRIPSFSSRSRRAERGSSRRSSERTARPDETARPMSPSPTRTERFRHSGVRKPWAAACSIRVRSSGFRSPIPQPVLPMSEVTERLIVSSTEGRSSRAVMSWLVRLSAASSSARRALSACRRACSTAEASGRATSIRISTSVSVKAWGSRWVTFSVPITSPCESSGASTADRKPRRDSSSRLTAGIDGSVVASSTRRGARWLATHAVRVPTVGMRKSKISGSAARAATSRTRKSPRSRSSSVTPRASKRINRETASAVCS